MELPVSRYTLEVSSDAPLPLAKPLPPLPPKQASPTVLLGRPDQPITIGRGPSATIDLRANKKVSRRHVTIRYNPVQRDFYAVVSGINGAQIGDAFCEAHDVRRVPLPDGCRIVVAGEQFMFFADVDAEGGGDTTASEVDELDDDVVVYGDENQPPGARSPKRIRHCENSSDDESSPPVLQEQRPTISNSNTQQPTSPLPSKPQQSLTDIIVESFTFCGRSDLNLRELCQEIQKNQAYYRRCGGDNWKMDVLEELESRSFFVLRPKNKLLSKPTQWHYNPRLDLNTDRRELYANFCSVQPTRGCKLDEKQYYFKDLTQVKKPRSSKRRAEVLDDDYGIYLSSDDRLASTVSSTDIGTDGLEPAVGIW
ncbi:hypothetical protein RI367_000696 [Sorochytrium milnesiophthora]